MDRGNQSVVWDGGEGVEVESREVPSPGPGELRVRVEASGLCGTDLHIASGEYPFANPGVTLGHEFSGTVVGLGEGVDAFAEGDRIVVDPNIPCRVCRYCHDSRPHLCENPQAIGITRDGGLSEFASLPVSQAYRVPEGLPSEAAALTEPLACALHAATVADPQPAQTVAVIGAGTIGLLAVAALRERAPHTTVLCVAKHSAQKAVARRLGADHVCAPERLHGEGARLTSARRLVGRGGREMLLGGFDRVLDCVGSGRSIEAAVTVTRPRGRVVLVGMPGELRVDLSVAWLRELELRGAYGSEADFPSAIALARRLSPGRLIDRGWPLRSYRRALEEAPRAARAGRVKTVFDVTVAA